MKRSFTLSSGIVSMLTLLICVSGYAQGISKRVLFIGNSYTYVNDLPGMTANVAASVGDTLNYDSHTVGGWGLFDHYCDTTSVNKIDEGNWDYIILQPGSIEYAASSPWENAVGLTLLNQLIKDSDRCAETVLYMTWGHKNGFAPNCPYEPFMCTYESMDSIIRHNYIAVADTYRNVLSPVGAVRHYIRHNYPSIELYQSDGSHPTVAGTYAAACCFYAILFRKDPSSITFNAGLPATDAANIRAAAKIVAFDSLSYWNVGKYDSIVASRCDPTGVEQHNAQSNTWQIAPNPATNMLTIHSKSNIGPIRIYNIAGEVVKETIISNNTTVNISDLPKGIYFIRAKSYLQPVYKFVKQ